MNEFDRVKPLIKAALQRESAGGSVDLAHRPMVSAQRMADAGYDIGGGYATTYTGTYSNANGDVAGNFTPIQYQNGELKNVLTDEQLQRYAESVLAGNRADDLGLQIGGNYSGANAISNADFDAQKQHILQEQYHQIMARRLEEIFNEMVEKNGK